MKTHWRFLAVMIFLVGAFSFVSAGYDDADYKEKISLTKYYPPGKYVTRSIEAYYEDDDRYSTYDYRWGYSYRAEEGYWEKYHDDFYDRYDVDSYGGYGRDKKRSSGYYYYNYGGDYDSYRGSYRHDYSNYYRGYGKDYYWTFNHATRQYEKSTCYYYPPRDQLFYMKC